MAYIRISKISDLNGSSANKVDYQEIRELRIVVKVEFSQLTISLK